MFYVEKKSVPPVPTFNQMEQQQYPQENFFHDNNGGYPMGPEPGYFRRPPQLGYNSMLARRPLPPPYYPPPPHAAPYDPYGYAMPPNYYPQFNDVYDPSMYLETGATPMLPSKRAQYAQNMSSHAGDAIDTSQEME